MKYAIIESGGKQYKVSEGQTIEIDKIDVVPGNMHAFEKILLLNNDGVCKVGQPTVSDASVSGKVVEQFKGAKIRVAKFKAKARYRKVTGHRSLLTRVQIEKISENEIKADQTDKSEIKKQTTKTKNTDKK